MWQPSIASSSSSLNPRAALNLPRLNFASSFPTRASLFNYYSPRGLRHFQGVLTITDGTGGSHTRHLHTDTPQLHCFPTLRLSARHRHHYLPTLSYSPPVPAFESNGNGTLRSRTKFNSIAILFTVCCRDL